ncbi:hypothetical protein AB9P05_12730 [Roseivirga sp. BDSF3-8]|uniref:hypothetical protein n=1 Tax=Roseivirga sp. BDSF3-8 TaxID=3241598 RepID=UPI0035320D26
MEDPKPLTFSFDDVVLVLYEDDLVTRSEVRYYIMPAFIYFQLLDARQNEQLFDAIDAAWMTLGIVTPIDEFFLLARAISYSGRVTSTINVAKMRVMVKADKIRLGRRHYDEITDMARANNLTGVERYLELVYPNIERITNSEALRKINELNLDHATLARLDMDLSDELIEALNTDPDLLMEWLKVTQKGLGSRLSRNVEILKRSRAKACKL